MIRSSMHSVLAAASMLALAVVFLGKGSRNMFAAPAVTYPSARMGHAESSPRYPINAYPHLGVPGEHLPGSHQAAPHLVAVEMRPSVEEERVSAAFSPGLLFVAALAVGGLSAQRATLPAPAEPSRPLHLR